MVNAKLSLEGKFRTWFEHQQRLDGPVLWHYNSVELAYVMFLRNGYYSFGSREATFAFDHLTYHEKLEIAQNSLDLPDKFNILKQR